MQPTLKLFNAIVVNDIAKTRKSNVDQHTLQYGFLFAPEVIGNYSDQELVAFIPTIEKEIGLTKEKMNSTFHKSWAKVKDANITQLVVEQLLHYLTTYGFEELGIYDKDAVYIPEEKLKIPNLKYDQIKIVVIHGYTREQVNEKINKLIASGIALKEDTINAVIETIDSLNLKIQVDDVKNKEVKCILCDKMETIPQNSIEFLRYLIYKVTGKTLLIKDQQTIVTIREFNTDNTGIPQLFQKYEEMYGLEPLSSIFHRFKSLFLAFKVWKELKATINKIRKLAVENHIPMKEDYLNTITALLKQDSIDAEKLKSELAKVNVFRKIRLAYALNYRLTDANAILYKIRNGKAYATTLDLHGINIGLAKTSLEIVLQSITTDVAKNVQGKKIYIEKGFNYALPATEKQFSGNIPCGSYVVLPANMVIGVYWENVENNRINNRIDLDLSLNGVNKIGWDSYYRMGDGDILFSGDMTDATNGATEAFFLKKQVENNYLLMLNYYNFDASLPVPVKIFASREDGIRFRHNYTVNPNKVEMIFPSIVNKKQQMLGLVVAEKDRTVFYIGETSVGNSITTKDHTYLQQARNYMVKSFTNPISLNDLLAKAGAIMVTKKEEADINLSVEALKKDTILKMLS